MAFLLRFEAGYFPTDAPNFALQITHTGFVGVFTNQLLHRILSELELLGLGPKSIMRRVHHLGGQLVLGSRPERGAALRVRVPA